MNGIPAMLSSQAPLYLPEDLKAPLETPATNKGDETLGEMQCKGRVRIPHRWKTKSLSLQVGDSINVWGRKVTDSAFWNGLC